MKRAELIIGKSYYMNKTNDWRGDHYSISESYAKTGKRLERYKVTIIETQLKTENEKQWRTRDVLIQNSEGNLKWVPLNWIRCSFIEAVKTLTDDVRGRYGYNDPANRYARHLQRKFQREQYVPALKTMLEEIQRVTGEQVYSWDKMESLEYETIKKLTQALSFIKTDLQAVAS